MLLLFTSVEIYNVLPNVTVLQSLCYFLALDKRSLVAYSLSPAAEEGQDNNLIIWEEST